ncbi:MAG: preprotein translocase subunit YajC [Deltaproteobacteria bacterium]|nr:preprotein translocase subunit YajC [Deltaproteobacteria bacterium]
MISVAWAQTKAPFSGGGLFDLLVPFAAMFLIFYFLLIRPQQKRTKEHQNFLKNLQRGDDVVTASGLHGKIHGLTDHVVTLEIAPECQIKIDRIQIARVVKGV